GGTEQDELSFRGWRRQLDRPVDRAELCRKPLGEERARALRTDEEHSAGRLRKLGQQALLRGVGGDEVDTDPALRQGLRRCLADGGDLRQPTRAASRQFDGTVRTPD